MFRRTNGNRVTRQSVVAILSLVLSVQLVLCDTNDNSTAIPPTISESSTIKNVISEEPTTSSSSAKAKQKPAYTTGNELWDNLIRDCLKKPTFSCIQKNVYSYLDTTLNQDDVNITSRLQLTRNQIEYEIPEAQNDEENEINFEGRGELRDFEPISFLLAIKFIAINKNLLNQQRNQEGFSLNKSAHSYKLFIVTYLSLIGIFI